MNLDDRMIQSAPYFLSQLTAKAQAIMLTSVTDAQEDMDIAAVDIPNVFVQTVVDEEDDEH